MKAPNSANTERLNCKIRADIKSALQDLAAKRHRAEGGYVGLTRVIAEASLLLLESEGIVLPDSAPRPLRRRARSVTRQKVAVPA
jgi:uncharacterized protein (DUF1778 family)